MTLNQGTAMKTCKNCRFWGRHYSHNESIHAYVTGKHPEGSGVGTCEFSSDDPAKMFRVFAEADDDSGLTALLETGPDFGCIHFSPATAAQ